MERLLKRRASSELQNLLSAVQTDYEFFANLDAIFESPPKKRPRNDYTSYKPKTSPLVCHQPLKSKIWDSREDHPTNSSNVPTRHVSRVTPSVSPDHWSRNQFETGFQFHKREVSHDDWSRNQFETGFQFHKREVSHDHWSKNQSETGFQFHKRNVLPKLTRIGLDTSLQTFYDSAGELSPSTPPPPAVRQRKVPVLGWKKVLG